MFRRGERCEIRESGGLRERGRERWTEVRIETSFHLASLMATTIVSTTKDRQPMTAAEREGGVGGVLLSFRWTQSYRCHVQKTKKPDASVIRSRCLHRLNQSGFNPQTPNIKPASWLVWGFFL